MAKDSEGRNFVLDDDAWDHIVHGHPELDDLREVVRQVVASPTLRLLDQRRGRERFFRDGVGPSVWLTVVVDWTTDPGRIVTAFAIRRLPRGAQTT